MTITKGMTDMKVKLSRSEMLHELLILLQHMEYSQGREVMEVNREKAIKILEDLGVRPDG